MQKQVHLGCFQSSVCQSKIYPSFVLVELTHNAATHVKVGRITIGLSHGTLYARYQITFRLNHIMEARRLALNESCN